MKLRFAFIGFWALMFFNASAQAHDPGLSGLLLRVSNSVLQTTLTLARADAEALAPIDLDRDGQVTASEFEKSRSGLEQGLAKALKVQLDGMLMRPSGAGSMRRDSSGEISFQQSFTLPAGSNLRVTSQLMTELPRGHRQYVLLRDVAGKPVSDRMLDATKPIFEVDLSSHAALLGNRSR